MKIPFFHGQQQTLYLETPTLKIKWILFKVWKLNPFTISIGRFPIFFYGNSSWLLTHFLQPWNSVMKKDEIKRNTTQNGFYNWPYGHVSSFLKDWIEFIEPWVSNSTNWRLFNAIISRLKVWRVWCLISFNDRLAKLEGTYVAELLYVHTSVYSFIYFFNLPCIIFLRKPVLFAIGIVIY